MAASAAAALRSAGAARASPASTPSTACFVPVRSKRGPWIVGVGGDIAKEDYGAETIVFDTKTQQVITGPKPLSTKLCPVLLTVGHRIYALSRNPSVKGEPDFVPWFEVLDISQAQVVDGRLVNCEWKEMPLPPFFPWG